jgi:hypothetical protein
MSAAVIEHRICGDIGISAVTLNSDAVDIDGLCEKFADI